MRKRILPLIAVATAVLVTVPLNAVPAPVGIPAVQIAKDGTITVRVKNEFRWEVNVQLVTKSGLMVDLGPVEPGTSLVATIAESVLDGTEPIQMRVTSLQSSRSQMSEPLVTDDTVKSRPFAALPGTKIEMHVGKELSASRLWVQTG